MTFAYLALRSRVRYTEREDDAVCTAIVILGSKRDSKNLAHCYKQ